jgi:glutathione synthase/RimK-type ligase-like ATP-grasp enzyme
MGMNLHLVSSEEELLSSIALYPDWYAQVLINKTAEYRVFLTQGKVVWVAEKIPHDPSAIVWNIHNETSVFKNVPWGSWPLDVCQAAITAFKASGLDFGAVDICTDEHRPYVLEINSAPSLPFLSDGSISYRQECTMKSFGYILDNDNKDWIDSPDEVNNWRDIVHPAIWSQQ